MRLSNGSTVYAGYRTAEQELSDRLNHDYMTTLQRNPPIAIGSEKQIKWAKAIASQCRNAKFWIDNRAKVSGSGETRIAVEKLIATLEREKAIASAMAARSESKLRAKVRRF